jgi:hypothetical protein
MPDFKRNKTLEKILTVIFIKYALSFHISTWEQEDIGKKRGEFIENPLKCVYHM